MIKLLNYKGVIGHQGGGGEKRRHCTVGDFNFESKEEDFSLEPNEIKNSFGM